MARISAKAVYNLGLRQRPIVLIHKICIRCDCKCKMCNSWLTREDKDKLLSREQIDEGVQEEADQLGMFVYPIAGGEPLLRRCPEIVAHAKALGFMTLISTNAGLLEKKSGGIDPQHGPVPSSP